MGEQKYDLEERTAQFDEAVIRYALTLPRNAVSSPLISQLVKSATSLGDWTWFGLPPRLIRRGYSVRGRMGGMFRRLIYLVGIVLAGANGGVGGGALVAFNNGPPALTIPAMIAGALLGSFLMVLVAEPPGDRSTS